MQAMEWINQKSEKNALFVATYGDAGMWIPTFTNRATLGTHIHFIHLVNHIQDSLAANRGPQYIFITKNDIQMHKEILTKIQSKSRVFANDEV